MKIGLHELADQESQTSGESAAPPTVSLVLYSRQYLGFEVHIKYLLKLKSLVQEKWYSVNIVA